MSERTKKVKSLVKQVVATELVERLASSGNITVTDVDVAPDLRQATVWIGVIGMDSDHAMDQVEQSRAEVQASLAKQMSSKFVPKISFKLDTGSTHAEYISKLIKDL